MNDLLKTYAEVLEKRSADFDKLVSKDMLVTASVVLKDQLVDFVDIANKNGKYDAADWLKRELKRPGAGGDKCAENARTRILGLKTGEDWRDVRAARDFGRD